MSENLNYYQAGSLDPRGLKYRLDADDVIEGVIDRLRGGFVVGEDGQKSYSDGQRLMNEEGIARVDFFLRGACTKIVHLSKFHNENRIMVQIRELARAFVLELAKNMKVWAPDAWMEIITVEKEYHLPNGQVFVKTVKERFPMNPNGDRVKNEGLILQVVENAMLASFQRGVDGFEAENLGKSWQIQETIGKQPGEVDAERSGLNRYLPSWGGRGGS